MGASDPFYPRRMSTTGEPPAEQDPDGKLTSAILVLLFVAVACGIWGYAFARSCVRSAFQGMMTP